MGAETACTSSKVSHQPRLPSVPRSYVAVPVCTAVHAFMCVYACDTVVFGVCVLPMCVYEACLCTCSSAWGWRFPKCGLKKNAVLEALASPFTGDVMSAEQVSRAPAHPPPDLHRVGFRKTKAVPQD